MYLDTVVIAGLLAVAGTLIFGGAVAAFIIRDSKKQKKP